MELYLKVRRAVMIDGMSRRSAAAYFGINRKTVDKMLVFPEPPQHGRSGRSYGGKLTGLTEIIDQILSDDRTVHAKQRHTGLRIFERLRDEHGFTGGITIERIGAILDVIEAWIEGTAFFGCNFVRAAAEYSDPGHPIGEQAKEHKQALLALISDQLEGQPEDACDYLASEILLIIEGAISVAQVGYDTAPVAVARRLIALVLKG